MSGAVSWEVLYWAIGLTIAGGGAVAGFLVWVWRIVVGLRRESGAEIEKLEAQIGEGASVVQLEKERAKLVEEGLRRMITDQAQHVAETYATKDGVKEGLGRVEKSIDRLSEQVGSAVERLSNRLDRFMELQTPPTPRRSRGGSGGA